MNFLPVFPQELAERMRQTKSKPAKATISTAKKSRKPKRFSSDSLLGMSDQQLLDKRICDLDVSINGTWLEPLIQQVGSELSTHNLRIKPHCWLADEWFSPDGIPGIGIPFYLAHPRLMRLERKQMFEVEGGTKAWCLRILRHEVGHAIDTAFRLHRRKSYKQIFGNYFAPYPDHYRPKPQSKKFVNHLDAWYSQIHPAEDFAETFAVWLNPRSAWQKKYEGWEAIEKIYFVEELVGSIAGKAPPVRSRAKVDPAHRLTMTLREYYQARHDRFGFDCPKTFDSDLRKLFARGPKTGTTLTAAKFLHSIRSEVCRVVSEWTGEYRYNINLVLQEMIEHCRELDLRATGCLEKLKYRATVMVTVHATNYLHGGHHRVSL